MNSNRFSEHPNSVGESYWQHFRAAMGYSGRMLRGALCCAVHGLCPWIFTVTGSETICTLNEEMQARRALANAAPANEPDSSLGGATHKAHP